MADQPTQTTIIEKPASCFLNLTAAFILLRLFMGVRLVLSGAEKMGLLGKTPVAFGDAFRLVPWFGPSGITAELPFGDGRMKNIAQVVLDNTSLPAWVVKPFLIGLPYAMLGTGLFILLGLFNRVAWWLAGLIWFSLAFGQMLLPDEATIQQVGLYLFVCALALVIIDHNRVRCTRF
jgi:thiosulfate dehydrogenase (quinone) large subunit